jgi:class 3 adenylate cyclase
MGRTGTVTVLFTDVVGSTDLLTRLGEREWNDVLRQHFAVLRTAIAEHDGSEVKNTGDWFGTPVVEAARPARSPRTTSRGRRGS